MTQIIILISCVLIVLRKEIKENTLLYPIAGANFQLKIRNNFAQRRITLSNGWEDLVSPTCQRLSRTLLK